MPSGRFTRTANVGGPTLTWFADWMASGSPATDTGRRSSAWRSTAVTSSAGTRFWASAAIRSIVSNSSRSP